MFTVEAAIPDRSPGTIASTAAVTATAPARARSPTTARAADSSPQVDARGEQRVDHEHPAAGQQAAEHHRPAGPRAAVHIRRPARRRPSRPPSRRTGARSSSRRIRHDLEVQRGEEEHGEQPKLVAKATAVALEKAGILKNSSRSDRVAVLALDRGRRGRQRGPRARTGLDPPGPEAGVLALDHGERERRDRHAAVTRPGTSSGAPADRSSPAASRAAAGNASAPKTRLNQKMPRQPASATRTPPSTGPSCERDPGDRGPHPERAGAPGDPDRLPDQGERSRFAGRRADAHHDPADDQRPRVLAQRPTSDPAKKSTTRQQDLLAAEQVAERAADSIRPANASM